MAIERMYGDLPDWILDALYDQVDKLSEKVARLEQQNRELFSDGRRLWKEATALDQRDHQMEAAIQDVASRFEETYPDMSPEEE